MSPCLNTAFLSPKPYLCMCIYRYVCMYACMYESIYIYIYTYLQCPYKLIYIYMVPEPTHFTVPLRCGSQCDFQKFQKFLKFPGPCRMYMSIKFPKFPKIPKCPKFPGPCRMYMSLKFPKISKISKISPPNVYSADFQNFSP